MATEITVQSNMKGGYPATPLTALSAAYTYAASDLAGNYWVNTGHEILLLQNTDVGATTVTITSQADQYNRLGTITTYSIPASGFAWFGPFPPAGWNDSNGRLNIVTSDVDLKIAVGLVPRA